MILSAKQGQSSQPRLAASAVTIKRYKDLAEQTNPEQEVISYPSDLKNFSRETFQKANINPLIKLELVNVTIQAWPVPADMTTDCSNVTILSFALNLFY